MPPRQPRLAWQETWSSRGSNRPAEDSLLAVERTPVEAFLPSEDSSLSEDSLLAEDSTSVEDILPAEDNSLAEDILPAEAIAQAAGSSQVEESQDDVQWLDPKEASEWDEEGGMPPGQPSLFWQETWSSEGSDQPAEDSLLEEGYIADEDSILSEDSEGSLDDLLDVERSLPEDTALSEPTNTAQLLEDAGKAWKLCRDKAVEFIRAYVRGTEKDDEEQKMLFLSKICDLCRCVTERGVPMNLHGFCSKLSWWRTSW
eukprot:XP_027304630.1 uncharacterized protein LOC113842148 [Anas platyrhynchos]